MARGGRRQPDPAKAGQYSNRSDLRTAQPIQTTSGGGYGSVKAQEDAQRAMPLENASGVQAQMASQARSVMPGDLGAFNRPTERPNEPLTQGVPIGAGAGPDALVPGTIDDTTASRIRGIYARYPNEGLRMLLEQMDSPS